MNFSRMLVDLTVQLNYQWKKSNCITWCITSIAAFGIILFRKKETRKAKSIVTPGKTITNNFLTMVSENTSQCGTFRIFLSLWFYVKLILDILEILKNAVFHDFRDSEFWFLVNFILLKEQKLWKIQSL